jgi:hypothetical protein
MEAGARSIPRCSAPEGHAASEDFLLSLEEAAAQPGFGPWNFRGIVGTERAKLCTV